MTAAPTPSTPTVAILGGGLAGLAAAVTAVQGGLRVELFEARRRLGGRAGSFHDPQSGELVDHCQHVWMGCCTSLADFCQRTGVADCFVRHARLHFIGPDGRQCDFAAAGWLPAPLHLLPGLLRLRYLGLRDRLHILRTMGRLAWGDPGRGRPDQTIGQWLRDQGESNRAIEWFWSVVLQSALSETVDRASLCAARKVFVDGFLVSRRAYELYLPSVPLGEIYDRRVGAWLAERGVAIHLGTRVAQVEGDADGVRSIVLRDGSDRRFDFYVVAVPWRTVRGLFCQGLLDALPALAAIDQIQPAAITAVHLWLDRPITPLPHAVLVDRLGQWLFHRGLQHGPGDAGASAVPPPGGTGVSPALPQETGTTPVPPGESDPTRRTTALGVHYEVVISASHELAGRDRAEVVANVWHELAEIWPEARDAQLLRWRMITQPAAVFSVRPGLDLLRPAQHTPVANLALAGDWTQTGWPATMESAVRSGYLAAQAVLAAAGESRGERREGRV